MTQTNEHLTYFTNVYEFGKEFEGEKEAVNFANEHDWSKEPISETEHAMGDYCIIDTTKDGKVEICYDYDWQSFFFVSTQQEIEHNDNLY